MKTLKKIHSFFLACFVATTAFAGNPLTIDDVVGGTFRSDYIYEMNMLADGTSYAQIDYQTARILKYDVKTGEQTGVLFDASQFNIDLKHTLSDIDDYNMSPDGKKMLIQVNTNPVYRRSFKADFYVYDIATKDIILLSLNGPLQNPVWAPKGDKIAFVRDNNIFLVDLKSGTETQVTDDGEKNKIINGIPDWVYEEEFGFSNAMTFSADGKKICFLKFDESMVRMYPLQFFAGDKPKHEQYEVYPGAYEYKYPKAGEDNAKCSAWAYDIATAKTTKINLPYIEDGYIPRILQPKDFDHVVFFTMNRHQDELNIVAWNPATDMYKTLLTERVDKYVKEEAMEQITFTKKHILLPSDRDGFMQVYLYDMQGNLEKKMTNAPFGVTEVYGFDEKNGTLYYQAQGVSPMQKEVYATTIKGDTRCLSKNEGTNSALFTADFRYFVNTWSTANRPYVFSIIDNQGKEAKQLVDNEKLVAKIKEYNLPGKTFFDFTTSEGVKLNGWMMKPADFDESKKYPVIMFQYNGPANQQVVDAWNIGSMGQGGLYDAYLTQQGFIIVCVDGRGTGGRGADFEKCTYLRLGQLESKDQVETALYLQQLPFVDKDNIGIWGWSYGGFNTLMSMSEGRPVFKAGVAVAPVTNWRYYDSVYSERFMRTPRENPAGYAVNPIERVKNLSGKLLICHGLADDNVHPQNAFEYSEALVQADKDFKEVIYTNRNHSIRGGNTRKHLLRQISQFFIENMK
ncbi:MAG: S9 family peptidase [Prevotella sp.]|nr:S9 family peptidase [Prevotella sp.]